MNGRTHTLMVALMVALVITFMGAAVMAGEVTKTGTNAGMGETGKKVEVTKGMLDGRHFMGEMGTTGKTTGDKEVITFKDGMFHSAACDPHGFKAMPYTTTTEGDAIKFSATGVNDKKDKMEWHGTVKGDMLDATATMTSGGKDPMTMWARGKFHTMSAEHASHKK